MPRLLAKIALKPSGALEVVERLIRTLDKVPEKAVPTPASGLNAIPVTMPTPLNCEAAKTCWYRADGAGPWPVRNSLFSFPSTAASSFGTMTDALTEPLARTRKINTLDITHGRL
jgi:hypothetical protein